MLSKFVIRVMPYEKERICSFLADHFGRSFSNLQNVMTPISDICIENGEYKGWSFGDRKQSYFYPAPVVSVDEGIAYLLKKKSQLLEEETPIISSQNKIQIMNYYHTAVIKTSEIKGKQVTTEIIPHSIRLGKNTETVKAALYREIPEAEDIEDLSIMITSIF